MKDIAKYEIDGILFDLGSTLLEYETLPWNVLDVNCINSGYSFLRQSGYTVPPIDKFWANHVEIWQRYRERAFETLEEWCIIDAVKDLLGSFNINGNGRLPEQFFEAYYAPVSRQLSIFADAHSVLQKLKTSGKRIGLVSNTYFPEEYHIEELKRFGLFPYLNFTVFSVTFGYRKPHPSIYGKALELLETEPKKTLFVGDRYVEDCEGPRVAGMHTIIKYRTGKEYPELIKEGQIIVYSLTEMLEYIAD
ncbi:MAG: HAD family hydrolase [Candidatus Zixiibacteriota bacterium]